jgi:hypothetical protein
MDVCNYCKPTKNKKGFLIKKFIFRIDTGKRNSGQYQKMNYIR